MLRGAGHNKVLVVLTRDLELLAIVMGGTKGFHPLKGGRKMFYSVLRRVAQKV